MSRKYGAPNAEFYADLARKGIAESKAKAAAAAEAAKLAALQPQDDTGEPEDKTND